MILWVTSFNPMMLSSVHQALADSRGIRVVWKNFLFTAAIAVVVTITMTWVGLLVINALLSSPGRRPGTWPGTCPSTTWSLWWGGWCAASGGCWVSYYLGASTGASITLLLAVWFFVSLLFRKSR